MSRAFNLYSRYSQEQLLARQQKVTGNRRNQAPDGDPCFFKPSPCRQLEDIELALHYHSIDPNEIV